MRPADGEGSLEIWDRSVSGHDALAEGRKRTLRRCHGTRPFQQARFIWFTYLLACATAGPRMLKYNNNASHKNTRETTRPWSSRRAKLPAEPAELA